MSDKMERAVAKLNERMAAVGLSPGDRSGVDFGPEQTARLFVGLPVSSREGALLVEGVLSDVWRQIKAGQNPETVLRGALRMTALCGILAALEPDE